VKFNSPLARAVSNVARLSLVPGARDDTDDASLAALLDHRLRCVLGKQERAGQDNRDLLLPFRKWHVEHALLIEDRRAVDQDVDPAVSLARPGDYRFDLFLVGDVAGRRYRPPSAALDVARAIRGVVGPEIDAYYRRALRRHHLRDAAADIGAGAGDNRDLAVELHAALLRPAQIIGRHCAGSSP
jgi:hypothetical protein